MGLSEETKTKIKESLNQKISETNHGWNCPICKCKDFILADGYVRDNLQENINGIEIGGTGIPQIVIICSHCGFIMKFSAGVLGLMASQEGKNDES